uniref:Si:dkey-45k15.1 n=1 Tax=Pygocentrus nattereri TaxID=42514 RepID=A0AAR2IR99_PYGNA
MAENEENNYQENISQKSPTSENETGVWKTIARTMLIRGGKNKKRDNEVCETEVTSPTCSTESPDTPSPRKEEGIFRHLSALRRSFNNGQKNRRKSNWESTEKPVTDRRNSKDFKIPFRQNIPLKPLSVLEIDELLKRGDLEMAYLNLLSLRLEIKHDLKAQSEKTPSVALPNKEKDLSMLFMTLRTKLTDIVRRSCDSTSSELLMLTAHIIQEEEKQEGDPGGMRGWMDAWKAAVKDRVRDTLTGVHLDSCENNASWLAEHLGLLGKVMVELLEKVKTELVTSYPPSFHVFNTYVSSCHEVVKKHLRELLGKVTELKDYYAILDFAINSYHSEKILGRPSLQPEMKEQKVLVLSDDFLEEIKQKYCNCLQKGLQTLLSNIIKVEHDDVWKKKEMPQNTVDGRFPISEIHIDILKIIAGFAENSRKIDGNLEKRVLCCCLEALKHFPKRFEEEFSKQNSSFLGSDVLDCCLWATYHVTYINSFISLKEQMECYRGSCPDQEDRLGMEVDRLVLRLRRVLLEQFKAEIEPYKESLMTKKWLKTDNDFNEIMNRIETYSGYTKSMKSPPAQSFANDLHYHAVKEYISELLKEKYSCKGKKNDLGAAKIKEQWDQLRKLFSDMGSTVNWLHPLGDQLSEIIEQKNEKDIKKLLPSFVENYPDISKKQFSAILYFRDKSIVRYSKLQRVIRHFTELKQNPEKKNHEHAFFSDIK